VNKLPDNIRTRDALRVAETLHGSMAETERRQFEKELNGIVCEMYGLSDSDPETLSLYYAFMRPPEEATGFLEELEEEAEP
jgi:hypothetical protein